MTLATHIVAGAAAAKILSTDPTQAFIIGWISHYFLDSITHWDYPLKAFSSNRQDPRQNKVSFNKYLILDMAKVIVDALIGFAIVAIAYKGLLSGAFDKQQLYIVLAGAIGGTMPDFVQFLYGLFKVKLFRVFQNFHDYVHADSDLNNRPVLGIALQILIILLIVPFI